MTPNARAYQWLVLAAGAISALLAVWQSTPLVEEPTAVCLALAVWASVFKVPLPGLGTTVSPGFVIVLVAAQNLAWRETLAVGCLCGLVQTIWRAKTTPGWIRLSFNVAMMAVSSSVAYSLSHAFAGVERTMALAAAGISLQVTNTLIVSALVCLMRNAPLAEVWRSVQFWTLPYYFAGGIVASLWSLKIGTNTVPLFLAVSVFLMDVFYRECARRYSVATAASA